MKKFSSRLGLGFWMKNFSFFSGLGIPRFFLFLLISLKWVFLRGGLVLVLFVSMVLFVSRSKNIFLFYFFMFPDFWVLSLLVVKREHFLWWLSWKESNAASVRVRVLDRAFARLSSETLVCGFSFSCEGIIYSEPCLDSLRFEIRGNLVFPKWRSFFSSSPTHAA